MTIEISRRSKENFVFAVNKLINIYNRQQVDEHERNPETITNVL